MGVTPARRLRDLERSEALRDAGRQENELKFTEFRLGCEAGSVEACNSLGEWYALMRQDFNTAMEYYTPGCFKKRYAQSCLNYGLIAGGRILLSHAVRTGYTTAAPTADVRAPLLPLSSAAAVHEAASMFEKGCKEASGGPSSTKCCGMLGALYLTEGSSVRANTAYEPFELLRQACDGEHVQSCFKLAKVYRRGALGVPPDIKLAEEFEQKGFAFAGMSELQATRAKKSVPRT